MIFLLVLFLLVVVFLAFFIGMNLTNLCTLWLFKTYTEVPVAILVLISFGAGIVFSLLLLLISKFRSSMNNSATEAEIKRRLKTEKRNKKSKAVSSEQLSEAKENADN